MIKLTKDDFREGMLKRQERRKKGKQDARDFINENWYKTREVAYLIRHTSQSAY